MNLTEKDIDRILKKRLYYQLLYYPDREEEKPILRKLVESPERSIVLDVVKNTAGGIKDFAMSQMNPSQILLQTSNKTKES